MTESNDAPSKADLKLFALEVTRQHFEYLKCIRTRGYTVDEAEIARLETEVAAEEATLREESSKVSEDKKV